MSDKLESWRNTLAQRLCNWIMWHVATPSYRAHIEVFVRTGMDFIYGPDVAKKSDPALFAARVDELAASKDSSCHCQ